MDYQEAMEKHKKDCRRCREKIYKHAIKKFSCLQEIDIKAYEELMSYRRIGTLEEVREAVERKQEKQVINISKGKELRFGTCPICSRRISNVEGGNYCQNCGQKLNWSEVDE